MDVFLIADQSSVGNTQDQLSCLRVSPTLRLVCWVGEIESCLDLNILYRNGFQWSRGTSSDREDKLHSHLWV